MIKAFFYRKLPLANPHYCLLRNHWKTHQTQACHFLHCQLRLQQFPRGLGKGSDAALVGAWLEWVMDGMTEQDVPVTRLGIYLSTMQITKDFFGGTLSKVSLVQIVGSTAFLFNKTHVKTEDACKDMFKVVKWGSKATNAFFRTIYNGMLWLSRAEAEHAIYNGWHMADPQ